jgi:glutaminyl-tRNA synthetase
VVQPEDRFQFEREGYFVADKDSRPQHLVFNRTVGLRDTWGRIEQQRKA